MSIVSTYLFYFIAFLFALQTSSCCVQQSSALPTEPKQDTVVFLNGGFEFVTDSITPFKWTIYGNGVFGVDSLVKFSGKYSGRLTSVDADTTKPSFVFTHINLLSLTNKTIKLKAKIKTELKDSSYAQMFFRLSGNGQNSYFGKELKGVNDWDENMISVKVDSVSSMVVMIGVAIVGIGEVWMDDVEIYVDDELISYNPRSTPLTQKEKRWLKKNIHDVSSDDFHASIGSSRIVGIGEESHGSANIKSVREEIIKGLIKNQGYTIVIDEMSDYATEKAEIVDDYILSKNNNIQDISNSYFLLKWIREYNKTAEKKIKYFGLETPAELIIETIERKTRAYSIYRYIKKYNDSCNKQTF